MVVFPVSPIAEKHEDPALCVAPEQTGPPLCGVLCPDWIIWAGIPEHLFSLLLHESGEERHELLTIHSDY